MNFTLFNMMFYVSERILDLCRYQSWLRIIIHYQDLLLVLLVQIVCCLLFYLDMLVYVLDLHNIKIYHFHQITLFTFMSFRVDWQFKNFTIISWTLSIDLVYHLFYHFYSSSYLMVNLTSLFLTFQVPRNSQNLFSSYYFFQQP